MPREPARSGLILASAVFPCQRANITVSSRLLYGPCNAWTGAEAIALTRQGRQRACQPQLACSVASALATEHPFGQMRGGLGNYRQIMYHLAYALEGCEQTWPSTHGRASRGSACNGPWPCAPGGPPLPLVRKRNCGNPNLPAISK